MPHTPKVPRLDFSDAAPFKIDGVYCKLIQLTQGLFTTVDATDYDWLSRHEWKASYCPKSRRFSATRSHGNRTIYMHREILGLTDPKIQGDHENLDRVDNRRKNLRRARQIDNIRNRDKQRDNTTGFKGVTLRRKNGTYISQIRVNRKLIVLGTFKEKIPAARAYDVAALIYFGEFARLNFQQWPILETVQKSSSTDG